MVYEVMNERIGDFKHKKEIIDGKIYLMASPCREHISVNDNLVMIFNNYFKKNNKKCRAFSNAQVNLDEKNYVQPDIQVLCHQNNKSDVPVIVVEILSKSTQKRDLGIKMQKYAELGIKEYWIVTWELTSIAVYLLTEEHRYEFYDSYALFTVEDKFDEEDREGTASEFFPLSFPELKVDLSDVFDIFR
jgi:Uma2 family endonuclease